MSNKIKNAISVGAALLADSVSGEGLGYIASSEEVGEGGREVNVKESLIPLIYP